LLVSVLEGAEHLILGQLDQGFSGDTERRSLLPPARSTKVSSMVF